MQSLRLIAAMTGMSIVLLLTRYCFPHFVDGIAVDCVYAFFVLAVITGVIGILSN